jgi:hypothetical protein
MVTARDILYGVLCLFKSASLGTHTFTIHRGGGVTVPKAIKGDCQNGASMVSRVHSWCSWGNPAMTILYMVWC